MTVLRARAPGKVNLCLFVGPTRDDGLHELVSVIESVSLADDVELAPAPGGATGDEVVCEGVEGPNLVAAALAEFRRATGWDAPPQRVIVTKRVPVAGGMGGGSADAAATLRLAAHAAGCEDGELLHALAFKLGADVPSQLEPGVCLVTGAGESVTALPALWEHAFVVVALPFRLSTAEVFAEADRMDWIRDDLGEQLADVRRVFAAERPPREGVLANDLAAAAARLCPPVAAALEAIDEAGADLALLSGSGPTSVGVYWGARAVSRAEQAAVRLRNKFPAACTARPVDATFGVPENVGAAA